MSEPNRNCPRGQHFPTDIIELIEGLLSALQMRLKFLDSKVIHQGVLTTVGLCSSTKELESFGQ